MKLLKVKVEEMSKQEEEEAVITAEEEKEEIVAPVGGVAFDSPDPSIPVTPGSKNSKPSPDTPDTAAMQNAEGGGRTQSDEADDGCGPKSQRSTPIFSETSTTTSGLSNLLDHAYNAATWTIRYYNLIPFVLTFPGALLVAFMAIQKLFNKEHETSATDTVAEVVFVALFPAFASFYTLVNVIKMKEDSQKTFNRHLKIAIRTGFLSGHLRNQIDYLFHEGAFKGALQSELKAAFQGEEFKAAVQSELKAAFQGEEFKTAVQSELKAAFQGEEFKAAVRGEVEHLRVEMKQEMAEFKQDTMSVMQQMNNNLAMISRQLSALQAQQGANVNANVEDPDGPAIVPDSDV